MYNDKKTIIFSIAHTYDLIFFYRIILETDIKEKYTIKILLIKHDYLMKKMSIVKKILMKISNDILFIDNTSIPNYSKHVLKNISLGYNFKNILKENYSKNDCLMILDKSTFYSNILLNFFKAKILFQFPIEQVDMNKYQVFVSKTIISNIMNYLLSCQFIKILKLKKSSKVIEEVIINLKYIQKVYISNDTNYENVVNFSSPIHKKIENPKKIVIFGNRYNGWKLNAQKKQKIIDYYRSIYKIFKDNYDYIYIMHPLEDGSEFNEIQDIFNGKLKLEASFLNSEHFLIEHDDIAYCFSIGSTSSKSAYQMGFNSKVAYRLIFNNDTKLIAFDKIFKDIGDDIHINSFDTDLTRVLKKQKINSNINSLYKII